MKRLMTGLVIVVGFAVSGCDAPSRPTPLATGSASATGASSVASGAATRSTFKKATELPAYSAWIDQTQAGHGKLTNKGAEAFTGTFIVWNTTDPINQEDVAHTEPLLVKPGETVDFFTSVYLAEIKPCAQRDFYINLPRQDRYTTAETANYFAPADQQTLWQDTGHCTPPPPPDCPRQCAVTDPPPPSDPPCCDPPHLIPPPPPPNDPQCGPDAFITHNKWHDDAYAYELVDVRKEYDGIRVFYISWGVPGLFVQPSGGGLYVPSNQEKQQQSFSQTLHAGLTQLKVLLANRWRYPAWQTEFGCIDAPDILVNTDISGSYIDFDYGNYEAVP